MYGVGAVSGVAMPIEGTSEDKGEGQEIDLTAVAGVAERARGAGAAAGWRRRGRYRGRRVGRVCRACRWRRVGPRGAWLARY
jgi:hypothetical protein